MSDAPQPAAQLAALEYAGPMPGTPPTRPLAVIVPAIIGMVWGATALPLVGPLAIANFILLAGPSRFASLLWNGSPPSMLWLTYLFVSALFSLMLNLLLLTGSIACLWFANWGRKCMIAWSWGSIAYLIFILIDEFGRRTGYGHYPAWPPFHPWSVFLSWLVDDAIGVALPIWILSTFGKERVGQWFGKSGLKSVPRDARAFTQNRCRIGMDRRRLGCLFALGQFYELSNRLDEALYARRMLGAGNSGHRCWAVCPSQR